MSGDLRRQVDALDWYHTIELAPGVVTPGWFDTRPVLDQLPIPASLSGRRVLDVGTFDGFWAFAMEKRGADEVVAIDVLDPEGWDWPAGSDPATIEQVGRRKAGGAGFEIARRELGSSVQRLEQSVYDLDPGRNGSFDFVYVGSLLLHLRDPVRALERVAAVAGGEVLLVDAVDLGLSVIHRTRPVAGLDAVGRPWWWKPNLAGLIRMAESAGLRPIGRPIRLFMPPGPGRARPRVTPRLLLQPAGRQALFETRKGDPHAAVLTRPA